MKKTIFAAAAALALCAGRATAQTIVLYNGTERPVCMKTDEIVSIRPMEEAAPYGSTEAGSHITGRYNNYDMKDLVLDLGLKKLWMIVPYGSSGYISSAGDLCYQTPTKKDLKEFAENCEVILNDWRDYDWFMNDYNSKKPAGDLESMPSYFFYDSQFSLHEYSYTHKDVRMPIIAQGKLYNCDYELSGSHFYFNPSASKGDKSFVVPVNFRIFRPVDEITPTISVKDGQLTAGLVPINAQACYDDRFIEAITPVRYKIAWMEGEEEKSVMLDADADNVATMDVASLPDGKTFGVSVVISEDIPYALPWVNSQAFFLPDYKDEEHVLTSSEFHLFTNSDYTWATRNYDSSVEDGYYMLTPSPSTASGAIYTFALPQMLYGQWDVYIEASPADYKEDEDGVTSPVPTKFQTYIWHYPNSKGNYESEALVPGEEFRNGSNYTIFPYEEKQIAYVGTFTHESNMIDDVPYLQIKPTGTSKQIRDKELTKSLKLSRIILKRHKAE